MTQTFFFLPVRDSVDAAQETLNQQLAAWPTPSLINKETNRESVMSDSVINGVVTSTVRESINLDLNSPTNRDNTIVKPVTIF